MARGHKRSTAPAPGRLIRAAREARRAGRPVEALEVALRALALRAEPETGLLAAELALEAHRPKQARACVEAVLRQAPRHARAWSLLGQALERLGERSALEAYRRAVGLAPSAETWEQLGVALLQAGAWDEAEMPCRQALRLEPDRLKALGGLVTSRLTRCRWLPGDDSVARLCERLERGAWDEVTLPIAPSVAQQLPLSERTLVRLNRAAGIEYRRFAEQLRTQRRDLVFDHRRAARDPRGRLRIGYLSSGLRDFPTGHLTRTLFGHHDRNRFEVHAYHYGPVDASAFSEGIRDGVDEYHVVARNAVDIARRIHGDGIHILVDLKGYSSDALPAVAALHPAPIQVNWLGFPGTCGDPRAREYIIVDRTVLPPEEAKDYAEAPVYLPFCYQPTDDSFCPWGQSARSDWALPEDAFVFCTFNNLYKLNPESFDLWMGILEAVPGAVLWLMRQTGEQVRNLQSAAQARGVDPRRLVFARRVSKFEHLERLRHADLALDNLPYGAHTTATDCLWAGVPILTSPGATFAGRVCTSIVRAAGFPELVAPDPSAYRERAIALATEPGALAALRDRLATARYRAPHFDTRRTARALDGAYEEMWSRWERGEPPGPIEAPDAGPSRGRDGE